MEVVLSGVARVGDHPSRKQRTAAGSLLDFEWNFNEIFTNFNGI